MTEILGGFTKNSFIKEADIFLFQIQPDIFYIQKNIYNKVNKIDKIYI